MQDRFRPHALIVGQSSLVSNVGIRLREAALSTMLKHQRNDRRNHRGRDNRLRPDAIDTPFLQHEGLEVGKKGRKREADFRSLKRPPKLFRERQYCNQRVARNPEYGDGKMNLPSFRIFVKGSRRERSKTRVVHESAVPVLRHGAGWLGVPVLQMDAQSERRNDNAGNSEKSDQKAHDNLYCSRLWRNSGSPHLAANDHRRIPRVEELSSVEDFGGALSSVK